MAEQGKKIELSGGRIAVIGDFKGKHVLEAQRLVGKEADKMIFALIATCVKIDGNSVFIEDLDDMNGADVLTLMGEFGENF